MAIPEHIIDQVHGKTDIVEVISRYIPLKKTGRNYKAPCPFHHEKTPSFVVSPDKQIYHCFGCGAGGNVFSFIMKQENLQFPEAVEMLADKAGVALPRYAGRSKEVDSLVNKLYRMNELACQFFQEGLEANKSAKEYLGSRGIGDESIKKFKIGYAPDAWESLINSLKDKGVDAALLEKAGLAVANDKGGHYDRFRNRITFPIIDLKDRILGFGARVLDSSLPKYINSPETLIYSKGKNLYGLNLSKEFIKNKKFALIVEGYLDFIIPYQAGVKNIIATLGTALTTNQVKALKRFTNTVVMVYDPDEAGQAASLRGVDLFISEDMNVYISELSAGLDPDGYIRKFGTEEFFKLIKSSKNIFDYKIEKLSRQFDIRSAHGKASIAAGMLPTIAKINNAVFKADLIKKLAEKLGVDEGSIKQELKKVKPEYDHGKAADVVTPALQKAYYESAEIMLLSLLFAGSEFVNKIKEALSIDEFRSSSIREIVSAIFRLAKENKEVTPAGLINHLGNGVEAADIISEAVTIIDTITDKTKALEDCVARMKSNTVKDRLTGLQDAIRTAHGQGDEERVKSLVTEYNAIVKIKA